MGKQLLREQPSFIPTTGAAMLRFRRMKSLQKFASIHANIHNHFNIERHIVDRKTFKERRAVALLSGGRSPPKSLTSMGELFEFALD